MLNQSKFKKELLSKVLSKSTNSTEWIDSNSTPLDVLVQREFLRISFACYSENTSYHDNLFSHKDICEAFVQSRPFLWSENILGILTKQGGNSLPLAQNAVKYPLYWVYANSIGDIHLSSLGASLLFPTDLGCVHVTSGSLDGKPMGDIRFHPWGASDEGASIVAKMLAFIDSPYIPKTSKNVSRGVRRKMGIKTLPSVTFLLLRQAIYAKTNANISQTVNWGCQWLVNGHFRNHYFPKEDTNKVIWIPPYTKGPKNKPFKQSVAKVSR